MASVSGTPISTTKFLRVLDMNINQYNQMFGRQLTSEEIQAFQIESMALGSLINNAVFENEFDSQNFIIDETVVASETKKRFPNLYNKNNKLNEKELSSFLNNQSLKIDDLVKIINYEARSKVFDELFLEIQYPNKFEKIIDKHNNHSRNIDLIKFNLNEYNLNNIENLDISITNEKIIDYFNKNINSYMNPEKRDISYILIDKKNFINQLTPSDSQILNYYNNNKSLFVESEKRDFLQFNFKVLEEASKFKIKTASFDLVDIIKFAEENNITFNKFTNVAEDEVLEELSDAIFSLQENMISPVIETTLAKHVIFVRKIYPEIQNTIEKSRDKIFDNLLEVELNNFILDLKNNISQQILDGLSLNEIANNNSLTIKNISKAERAFDNTKDDLVRNEVIIKAFSTNKDFVSDIEDIDDDQSIIINVDNIFYEKPYELNQVLERVSEDWIKSLKIKQIKNYIDDSISNSKLIKDLAAYFKSETTNIDIKFKSDDFPITFKSKVFENEIDKIYFSVSNNDIYVAKTNEVTFPNDDYVNSQELELKSELRSFFGAEIVKKKNISTNDNLIRALINQY
ncbi:MAG: peptidyl-prolyl cis-trans isomerase [Alphaproteobacteria bacterium]